MGYGSSLGIASASFIILPQSLNLPTFTLGVPGGSAGFERVQIHFRTHPVGLLVSGRLGGLWLSLHPLLPSSPIQILTEDLCPGSHHFWAKNKGTSRDRALETNIKGISLNFIAMTNSWQSVSWPLSIYESVCLWLYQLSKTRVQMGKRCPGDSIHMLSGLDMIQSPPFSSRASGNLICPRVWQRGLVLPMRLWDQYFPKLMSRMCRAKDLNNKMHLKPIYNIGYTIVTALERYLEKYLDVNLKIGKLAQSVDHVTLVLMVMSSSSMLGIEPTLKRIVLQFRAFVCMCMRVFLAIFRDYY